MQERLLGAALGSAFAGIVVFEQRKSIYRSISDPQHQLPSQFHVNPLSDFIFRIVIVYVTGTLDFDAV